MEDDEKKKRKKDENPYELKEEFPDTINIKPTDEQPEAPAVEAPAEENPPKPTDTEETPATTQTQTTAESAEQTEERTPLPEVPSVSAPSPLTQPQDGIDMSRRGDSAPSNKEVRQANRAKRQAARQERRDGTDADSDNERTPLPEMPEQGDTSALQGKVETEQQPSGIDLSKREYGENPETEARNRQFVNNADELERPDESALSPLTQPQEGIDLSKREHPTDSDLTPEQVVSKYKTKEELEAHGFNEDGTPLSADAEGYNPETDPNVQGIRDATATRKQGYDDYLNFIEDFYNKKEEYDRQRQERDSRNAFWRSIGEVGASLVNLLGVSGAFSGRNAYGRGAYSSMQKFDLTTPKLTDKMWADIDKRKEQMDALRLRQAENRLKLNEILAGGQEKEGAAKAQGQKAYEDKAYRDAQIAESKRQFDETMQYKREKDAADEKLRLEIAKIQADAAKEIQKIKNSSSGKWPTNVTKPIRYTYPSGDGTKSFDCDPGVVDTALQANFQKIADCLARTLDRATVTGKKDDVGKTFDSVTDYISAITNMPDKKRYKYEGDDPIERALYNYYKDIRYIHLNDITKDKQTTLLDWARDAFMRTEESGKLIEDAVAPAIAVAQSLIAAYGGGDDTDGGIILPEGMDEETARLLGYIGSSNNQ